MISRRTSLKLLAGAGTASLAAGGGATRLLAQGSAATSSLDPYEAMIWGKGYEGQRRADLGDGRFLNPVFAGDHPDPTILRDGEDYYLTFSSFDAYPGIVIWHSRDLVNWSPVTAALKTPIGSVWAPELARHKGRFYCYIPARFPERKSIYVIHAERIEGPWSEPVDLHLPEHIDPGHIVDRDGRRWLFLSGGDRVPLAADGLSTAGPVEHVYDPWRYPEDWIVETFSPEGPKVFRRGAFFYMVTAVGGTAGPPTGHMVIVARSRSLAGPWENDPANPIVRTRSAREKWWSRGHATPFEGPGGRWWMIHHGYENGYWTLGRQALLEPIEWTADGWFRPTGGDLSAPLPMPRSLAGEKHGFPLSDDFTTDKLGVQWSFYDPARRGEAGRVRRDKGILHLRAKGSTPSDSSPITFIAGDHAYRIEADVEVDPEAEAGLLLFYNRRLYAGLGLGPKGLVMHRYGLQRLRGTPPGQRDSAGTGPARALRLRLTNDRNILTLHTSEDRGGTWRKFDVQMEVSGYHHNVAYDFLSLRPALYAAGTGEARFANFTYQALA
ncbi:MAG: family 43 glycosylhydrolase [Alphaproteobacteria bacterium]|nr:family 43 glycosylhydrolase [Alphaproteobacteria bacterium]MBV9372086.1 family 43 glycosylhydrolase [Alphaproteobacteria bacterium]MBV9901745.1 family 43 glycosylhydrolase [Alphaproteobacteria bacterium]